MCFVQVGSWTGTSGHCRDGLAVVGHCLSVLRYYSREPVCDWCECASTPVYGRLSRFKKAEGKASYPGAEDPGVRSVTRIFHYYKKHGCDNATDCCVRFVFVSARATSLAVYVIDTASQVQDHRDGRQLPEHRGDHLPRWL